ncbi:MAG: 16S rRNA methyltransferase, partial [Clostridiales bacterium]|nr:16S rRNA methyltransferase [Clostridiales bacterium]
CEGLIYPGVLKDPEGGIVTVSDPLPSPEPTVRVTLYQGIPKGDKMDMICQKCTEAGIACIVPVEMERCVARIDRKDAEKKVQRWQRIIQEAAKQSGRAAVPVVEMPITVKQLAERMKSHELCLVPWEEAEGCGIRGAWNGEKDVAVLIGPEGGISEKEIAMLPAKPVTLGKRIFRTETAGLAALIEIMCISGNMD